MLQDPTLKPLFFLRCRANKAPKFSWPLCYAKNPDNLTIFEIFPSFRSSPPMRRLSAAPPEKKTQWLDIWDVASISDYDDHQAIDQKDSVAYIQTSLAAETTILDNRWGKVVLGGLSQGRLGAVLGVCCRISFPGKSVVKIRKGLSLNGILEAD
ncbi:hypothetical protein HYALB_00009290 [Hymenoscyphus albidus]|uniref:Uncharacterized protein n=1 Tax=Hymenoscyphus albidus TaxID=595503 RepID=A0A9N9LHW5_9HELO|nr:hypothetical protein HYALB_00009290 [Hymenoscyphus albidus]